MPVTITKIGGIILLFYKNNNFIHDVNNRKRVVTISFQKRKAKNNNIELTLCWNLIFFYLLKRKERIVNIILTMMNWVIFHYTINSSTMIFLLVSNNFTKVGRKEIIHTKWFLFSLCFLDVGNNYKIVKNIQFCKVTFLLVR